MSKGRRKGPPLFVLKDMETIHSLLNIEFGFDILKGGRKREYVDARRVFAQILNEKYDLKSVKLNKLLTLTDVGNYLGGVNHATVINLLRNFDVLCRWDYKYKIIHDRVLSQSISNYDIVKSRLLTRRAELCEEIEQLDLEIKELEDEKKESHNQDFNTEREF